MKFHCLLTCMILLSCSSKKVPGDVLPPDRMGDVLWEQMTAAAFTQDYLQRDSSKNAGQENEKLQEKIFQKYHTDRETYERSYHWYVNHGEIMRNLLDSVTARRSRERDQEKLDKLKMLKKANEQSK